MAAPIGAIVLDEKDNVATAVRTLVAGEQIRLRGGKGSISIVLVEEIPTGHKVALADIRRGDYVIKYGEVIGKAAAFVRQGSLVHVHNVRGRGDKQLINR